MGAVSGDINSLAMECVDAADLASRPIASMKSGDRAYVSSKVDTPEGPLYYLDRNATVPVDGVGVLATLGGVGRWLSEAMFPFPNMPTVANLTALEDLDDVTLRDGALVYVQTLRDYFQKYVVTPVPTTDGITSVPTKSGDGVFNRLSNSGLSWVSQTTWYVDSVLGDDENPGSSAGAGGALATVAEFTRRMRVMKRGSSYTLHVDADVPNTDFLSANITLLGTGVRPYLYVKGSKNTVSSGTLSAGNTSDPKANIALYPAGLQASITDASRAWTLGQVVYFTSGGAKDACCFVLRDMGSGVARVSQPFYTNLADNFYTTLVSSSNTPTNGTTYDIVEYTKWRAPVSFTGNVILIFSRFDFSESVASFDTVGYLVRFRECVFSRGLGVWAVGQNCIVQTTGCCIGTGLSNARTTLAGMCPNQNFQNTAFIFNRLAPSSRVVSFDGCTFQGDSDFSASPPVVGSLGSLDVGYGSTQPAPSSLVTLRGVNAWWDWGTGIGGGAITVLSPAATVQVLNNLSGDENFIMGSGGYRGVEAIAGGQFIYPPSVNATYAPRLIGSTTPGYGGWAADIVLDNLSGSTDGASNSPIPALVPNAVVPNSLTMRLYGGAGWAKWETSFSRRLLSHWTRSAVYAWPY